MMVFGMAGDAVRENEKGAGGLKGKVFVTGVNGQLGHDVVKELKRRGYAVVGSDLAAESEMSHAARPEASSAAESETCCAVRSETSFTAQSETSCIAQSGTRHVDRVDGSVVKMMEYISLDITDRDAVERVLSEAMPDAVIHCAAWTAVDMAEDDDKAALVRRVNVDGTRNIAEVCRRLDCKMVYISTDYVFDGQGTEPWQPDCRAYQPLNVYGQTKLEGELAVSGLLEKYFIVRTAWVFGLNGKNFIRTMISVGKTHDTVRVVSDQIGTPTYTLDLARLLVDMIGTEKYGYYHATNEGGYISWYEFCCEFYRQYGMKTKVIPVTTEEYGLNKAVRPFNSRLDKRKLAEAGFVPLPVWQDAVRRYLEEAEL